MEDTEFEDIFAVYAADEVAARKVLTPAMMRRITGLRKKFGREMMLTFTGNRFYISVSMPDGFLSLKPESLRNGNLVEEITEDIRFALDMLKDLKLT